MMADQLDLFLNGGGVLPQVRTSSQHEAYKRAVAAKTHFIPFVDRRMISDIASLIQNSTFTWSNSLEGAAYWSEVAYRLQLIGESITEREEDNRPRLMETHARIVQPYDED